LKADALRKMDPSEIEGHLKDLAEELFNLRFQAATGQLENTARLRSVRRDIARARTILRAKELETAGAAEGGEAS